MRFLFKVVLPFLFVAFATAIFVAYYYFNTFKYSSLSDDIEVFKITKGSSIRTVSQKLERENILKPALLFTILAKITKKDTKIKAGEYQLKKGMSPDDLLALFTEGKTIQYQIRIPEGSTFKEIAKILQQDTNLIKTLKSEDYQTIMSKLDTDFKDHQPEGWFFPDTYNFPRGTTDVEFLQRSHNQMVKLLDENWKKRKPFKGIDTPYDALILSSIIEKETGHPDDRGKVARVFINRLEKNMLLQTDPTVIYGMGDKYKGNIRKRDLTTDTPFNTYTRKGLTPTPIATPSKASIEAAFNPDDGDIYYFVAKGDGTSYFSKNYSEHKRAVIKYLLNGNAKRYKGN